jgi:hypothetical protein
VPGARHRGGRGAGGACGARQRRGWRAAAAAAWFLRGRDARRLNGIAGRLLDAYIEQGDFDAIDAIAPALELSDAVSGRLLFVADYRTLHRLREVSIQCLVSLDSF